jgi:hypothetical protein
MFGGGMLAPSVEDDLYGAIGTEPSEYQRMAEEKRMQRMLDAQIRKYGDDAMRVDPKMKVDSSAMPTEEVEHSYQLRMPGSKAAKVEAKDPLRSLMKQMNLTMGPKIEDVAGTKPSASTDKVEKLPEYDTRGPAPLRNPQKQHHFHPAPDAHGLCLSTGMASAFIGGVSSGKTTTLLSCLAHNHSQYRYENVWLMHPDAEAAKSGEYGLCSDIQVLDHFPTMDWWEKSSPGRTALIIDDASWQLSKRGTPSQHSLADRTLGYLRSHKSGSLDIYIGQQQVYGIPPNIRKLISTWFLFPKRISPQTHTALAQATMLDKHTLRRCLDFVDGPYGFLLVNALNDGRPRARVNGWRAVEGLL